MKANQRSKSLVGNRQGFAQIVGGLVALMVTIIIGVLVYYSIYDTDAFSGTTYEEFGPYVDTTNASAWSVTVDSLPNSKSDVNVTCVNVTAGAESYPTFSLLNRDISVAADAASNFTQVNITYTSKQEADISGTDVTAGTIFTLLPIIAIVAIGSIMIIAVSRFGGSGGV
jgi:hypothetical protein